MSGCFGIGGSCEDVMTDWRWEGVSDMREQSWEKKVGNGQSTQQAMLSIGSTFWKCRYSGNSVARGKKQQPRSFSPIRPPFSLHPQPFTTLAGWKIQSD